MGITYVFDIISIICVTPYSDYDYVFIYFLNTILQDAISDSNNSHPNTSNKLI